MNEDLATHISLLAAPIYAALWTDAVAAGASVDVKGPEDILNLLRQVAIEHAYALWLATLERK